MDSTYILLQHYWWFVISLLGAVSIDELVNDSFEKNYDIKSLEKVFKNILAQQANQ